MSKRNPTEGERIAQSVASRTKLIEALQATLDRRRSEGASEVELQRLEKRIAGLSIRNENPKFFLGHGKDVYWRVKYPHATYNAW